MPNAELMTYFLKKYQIRNFFGLKKKTTLLTITYFLFGQKRPQKILALDY